MTFLEEIYQQPESLKLFIDKCFNNRCKEVDKLKSILIEKNINQVIFTGMGSSLFASYVPCNYLRGKGIKAFALESNELLKYDKPIIDDNTLLVVVSQSGESEEVIAFCNELKSRENVVIVTNYNNSNLYRFGKVKFEIYAGCERNTASKTYTNTIAMLVYIAYIISGENENEINKLKSSLIMCADKMEKLQSEWKARAYDICNFIGNRAYLSMIGSGTSYSTASQGELILEEAGRIYSSRYTTGQFIHGPIELVDENFSAIILDFDAHIREKIDRIINNIIEYEGKVLLITNRDIGFNNKNLNVFKINHEDSLTSPILEILPIELFVNEIGLKKNLQPGVLSRVIK